MLHIFTGLFDSHTNGVDLLWLAFAVAAAALTATARRRQDEITARAERDLAPEFAPGGLLDPDFEPPAANMIYDDGRLPWAHDVTVDTEIKGIAPPEDVAKRQERAYLYLLGSRARTAIEAADSYGFAHRG